MSLKTLAESQRQRIHNKTLSPPTLYPRMNQINRIADHLGDPQAITESRVVQVEVHQLIMRLILVNRLFLLDEAQNRAALRAKDATEIAPWIRIAPDTGMISKTKIGIAPDATVVQQHICFHSKHGNGSIAFDFAQPV